MRQFPPSRPRPRRRERPGPPSLRLRSRRTTRRSDRGRRADRRPRTPRWPPRRLRGWREIGLGARAWPRARCPRRAGLSRGAIAWCGPTRRGAVPRGSGETRSATPRTACPRRARTLGRAPSRRGAAGPPAGLAVGGPTVRQTASSRCHASPREPSRSRIWPRRKPRVRPLLVRPVEHEIAVQEDIERLARADRNRGRHVEPAPEDLERDAGEFLAEGARGDLTRRWRCEDTRLLWLAQLGAGAHRREEERLPEDALPVRVHLALRPGLAGEVLQGQAREPQTPAVWEDEPGPRDEETVLAGGDLVVVGPDEPSAFGDEADPLGAGVEDVPTHLPHEVARQIRVDPGDEETRDDRPRLQRVGRARGLQ